MRKIDKDELKIILKKHMMWLNGEDGGERADMRGADMRGADMSWANMRGADMREADMKGADMRGADMREADMKGADMSWANMNWADMIGADMREADMSWANMRGADMKGADMRGANMKGTNMKGANMRGADMSEAKYIDSAKNLFYPLSCPEVGEYIGFKKADGKIIKLKIPTDAKRSSSTNRKCRASKAVVVSITELDGTPAWDEVCSDYDKDFVYRVGETVEVQNFDENRWNECAPGIHHYITREEAVRH